MQEVLILCDSVRVEICIGKSRNMEMPWAARFHPKTQDASHSGPTIKIITLHSPYGPHVPYQGQVCALRTLYDLSLAMLNLEGQKRIK
jgi:hypothetical protein